MDTILPAGPAQADGVQTRPADPRSVETKELPAGVQIGGAADVVLITVVTIATAALAGVAIYDAKRTGEQEEESGRRVAEALD